jgi:hypothetical protein
VGVEDYTSGEITAPANIVFRVRAISTDGFASPWALDTLPLVGRQNNLDIPTSFRATGGVDPNGCLKEDALPFAIRLDWTFPIGVYNIRSTQVFYNTVPISTGATLLSEFAYPTRTYTLNGLETGDHFWFFVRFVDTSGHVGPWHTFNGTKGAASCRADAILKYLNNQITQGQLHQSLITKIDSKLDPSSQAIVDMQTKINNTYGEWTVKIQSGNYVAGVGLMADSTGSGGVRSSFIVRADRFAVGHPNHSGSLQYPFIIQGGKVYIAQAAIGNAWITSAKIHDLSVTNAKIGWNAVTEMISINIGQKTLTRGSFNRYSDWVRIGGPWNINFRYIYGLSVIASVQMRILDMYTVNHEDTVVRDLAIRIDNVEYERMSDQTDYGPSSIYWIAKSSKVIPIQYAKTMNVGAWGTRSVSLWARFGTIGLYINGGKCSVDHGACTILLAKK